MGFSAFTCEGGPEPDRDCCHERTRIMKDFFRRSIAHAENVPFVFANHGFKEAKAQRSKGIRSCVLFGTYLDFAHWTDLTLSSH
jgi:hypothetical protein